MATEKALFTTQADFKTEEGIGISVDPFLSYDPEDRTGWTVSGTPVAVPGIKGNAESYVDSLVRRSISTRGKRNVISLFFKPTVDDVALNNTWHILFTNRFTSNTLQSDWGFHLACYNGQLNARAIGSNGNTSPFSVDTGQIGKTVQADTLYHCIFKYDEADGTELEVWMKDVTNNGAWERWLYSSVWIDVGTFTRDVTIGDMTRSTPTYDWNGWIDEFKWFSGTPGGTDTPSVTELQTTYHDFILNANWNDWFTEPGSLMVGKSGIDGSYTQNKRSWTSQTIDLDLEGFGDFGRIQFNYEQPTGTFIELFTRASQDELNWTEWIKVANDGTINSGNDYRYLQIKADFWTTLDTATPKIMEIQVLDYPKRTRLSLTSEPLIIHRDLETGLERMGELVNAYDIFITEEIIDGEGGEETIEFKMAMNDPKRLDLGSEPVELIAQIGDKAFILRDALDQRDEQGKKCTVFTGESRWYELRDAKVIDYEVVEQDARVHVEQALARSIEPTGWTIYNIIHDGRKRTIRGEWKSVLELLLLIADEFELEIFFDSVNMTITMQEKIGENNGVRFYYNKNLKTIERNVNTYDLITRLYLYGKNGMTVSSVHPDGLEYVENTFWVEQMGLRRKIRIDRFSDGRYIIPQNLYDVGVKMIDELSKPSVSYAMTVNDLSVLSGHEHESIGLGDTVYAVDTELLNLLVDARIVRRKYNVRQVWKTEIELNQPKKTLADANERAMDEELQLLVETDPLDTSDVQQMTVFNHLLNSRAEDGIAYWEQTGTGITPVIGGFSGDASWEVIGGYGTTKSLKQSIFGVSHRSAYTISAYVGNEGTITRGSSDDAFVGIRVRIHYTEPDSKGNTYEDHFLAIPDITQEV